MGNIGGQELLLIMIIGLIVFGPRKLPEIGKSLGKMLVEFRKASSDFKRTIEEEVEAEKARETEPARIEAGPHHSEPAPTPAEPAPVLDHAVSRETVAPIEPK